MYLCDKCKKKVESLKYIDGKMFCLKCEEFNSFSNCLDFYKYPNWFLKVVFYMGKLFHTSQKQYFKDLDFKPNREVFGFIETVNYKNYKKNRGNVSKARIAMVKSRKLAPDGNGEVVMRDSHGKITDKLAYNF